MKKNTKGFTLIELLVVIAIIGILASVVLASLSTARSKGADAKVQGQLSNMRAQAEIYYGTNNNYGATGAALTATCTATGTLFLATAANGGLAGLLVGITSPKCAAASASGSATSWAVSAPLVSSTTSFACVDSNGSSYTSGSSTATVTGSVASCV